MGESILKENEEYKDVKIQMINENKEVELANSFDYYYVPTFYVGDKKIHEGVPTKEKIERVFKEAL